MYVLRDCEFYANLAIFEIDEAMNVLMKCRVYFEMSTFDSCEMSIVFCSITLTEILLII